MADWRLETGWGSWIGLITGNYSFAGLDKLAEHNDGGPGGLVPKFEIFIQMNVKWMDKRLSALGRAIGLIGSCNNYTYGIYYMVYVHVNIFLMHSVLGSLLISSE